MEWRAAVRFQKYFSMVGESNVWWPATRVSLCFSRAILPCGGRLRFTCWLKWRETLVVGVCSLFCVLSRATTAANLSFTRVFLHRAPSNSTLRIRARVNLGFYHRRRTQLVCTLFLGSSLVRNCEAENIKLSCADLKSLSSRKCRMSVRIKIRCGTHTPRLFDITNRSN